jgi:hypothetical protein
MERLWSTSKKALGRLVKPRMLAAWGPRCDTNSLCARTARDIVSLVQRKRSDQSHQDERIREEILAILDHDKLLTDFQCNALALLTLNEALRLLLLQQSEEGAIAYVERIHMEIQDAYRSEIANGVDQSCTMPMRIHKHLGHGIKYLEERRKQEQRARGLASASYCATQTAHSSCPKSDCTVRSAEF